MAAMPPDMAGIAALCRDRARAMAMFSDLDYAYQLQMEEAMAASAGLDYDAWRARARAGGRSEEEEEERRSMQRDALHAALHAAHAQSMELELRRWQQEGVVGEEEEEQRTTTGAVAQSLQQRGAHDLGFARAIAEVPEDEWGKIGDTIEQPFEEEEEAAAAAAGQRDDGRAMRLDCDQGFQIEVQGVKTPDGHVGIGCMLSDLAGKVVWQQSKYLGEGLSWHVAEYTGLLEAMAVAERLGLRRLYVRVSSSIVVNQVKGFWKPKLPNQWRLMTQVLEALQSFSTFQLVSGSKATGAIAVNRLAYAAIASHFAGGTSNAEASTSGAFGNGLQQDATVGASTSAGPSKQRRARLENCLICFEDKASSEMATVKDCLHKFCTACMKQHAEVQVQASQVPVRCPQAGCPKTLQVEECRHFLTKELFNTLCKRLIEASVPEGDRVYCPFANCSALMDKSGMDLPAEVSSSAGGNTTAYHKVECVECRRSFCVDCRVPWHWNRSCQDYQNLPPELRDAEDSNLYKLAQNENWQRCKKCRRMIELAEGCYHMTCRCGHEFCYTCGAEWKNKKQSCSCKLWDERNIVRTPLNSDDEFDDDAYDYDDDDEDDEELDEEMQMEMEMMGVDFSDYEDDHFRFFDGIDNDSALGLEDFVHELVGIEGMMMEPPAPPPYPHRFYKTKLCRYYLRPMGCTAGSRCTFAHGEHELRHV